MALKRYKGPFDKVAVRVAGHDLGYVEKGGSIFVPEHLIGLTVWPEKNWEDGAPPVKEKKISEKGDDK